MNFSRHQHSGLQLSQLWLGMDSVCSMSSDYRFEPTKASWGTPTDV